MNRFKEGPSAGVWQWAVFAAFVALIMVVTGYGIAATVTLRSRDSLVDYLQEESLWDHCNESVDREFFVATSDLIDLSNEPASTADPVLYEDALARLLTARDHMQRINDSDVCGPPPTPPSN